MITKGDKIMSATNSTTHYELPVFIATDKPAWLVDWNGSMNAIDAGINAAKSAADTAQAGVTANASNISTLSSTVSTQGSSLSTLSENLTTLTGTVNTITSLIGNGEPTTTDKTIIGAINEINDEISSPTAAGISYDNTTSGLTADDVQEAIDENAASIATLNTDLTYNTMNINSSTKRSDILTIVKNSILKGKIPHITTDFVFTASGVSYTIKDEVCTYSNDYEDGTTLQFGGFYARHTLLLSLNETGASLVSSDTNQPVTLFSNAKLYY